MSEATSGRRRTGRLSVASNDQLSAWYAVLRLFTMRPPA